MDYRNADGSVSEMCGNGVRVFAHFLLSTGLLTSRRGAILAIATRGRRQARGARSRDGYAVDMGPWEFIFPDAAVARGMRFARGDSAGSTCDRPALSISMGNPHTVVALAEPAELRGRTAFRPPPSSRRPPEGTNVEYVVPDDPLVGDDGVGRVRMRVHERGVGETQSCGTGACAAAAATRFWAGAGAPDPGSVEVPGGVVGVALPCGPDGREHVSLSGPAVLVAKGRCS